MGKVLVLGRGASGKSAATLLRAGGREAVFAEGYDLVVASPGIKVVSELQLGCEELKRRGWKLLAVTGSKGKSSVVKAVADALSLAGRKAVPCGNYGRPVCDLVDEEPGWAVVEVSSFQLETTALANDTFEASVVLNVQEEHLDRHGSMSVYYELKHRLAAMSRLHMEGRECQSPEELESSYELFRGFMALIAGSYFDNPVLCTNGAYAVALMRVAGLDDAQIRRGFEGFKPLPHRFQTVAEIGGVRYVDDSKATSVAALVAGVAMCGPSPVRLIAGGLPKGDDPAAALSTLTSHVKKVYLIGQCAESFLMAWRGAVDCEVCGVLAKAVESAKREAVSGETVLLSPGAASFDQFQSFGERGDAFADLVKKEGQKR